MLRNKVSSDAKKVVKNAPQSEAVNAPSKDKKLQMEDLELQIKRMSNELNEEKKQRVAADVRLKESVSQELNKMKAIEAQVLELKASMSADETVQAICL
jgi:hypothetical protein